MPIYVMLSTLGPQGSQTLREQPDRPLIETLVEALKPKQVLLLLDNCEHLVAACARLAEVLLRACPHLRILTTTELNQSISPSDLTELHPHEHRQIHNWKPYTVGELLFNHWD